ncbi:MAG: M23 family metallopeptidase [Hyphomicrobiales bacterium]
MDVKAGPGAEDYTCGRATYEGHKGTDFRLPTLADAHKGVAVLAAADGTVKGLRDGMADRLVKSPAQRESIKKRECGNGVLLDHGNGFETQYCHMRKGSVRVKKGDKVARGEPLGLIGYSGAAGFAHVHISVRKDGKTIDPFKGVAGAPACGKGEKPLWRDDALANLNYDPTQVIGAGFAEGAVKLSALESGRQKSITPETSSNAIFAWGWAINLQKGDIIVVVLKGPEGVIRKNDVTLDRDKAQYMLFAGTKKPQGGWPKGAYESQFKVTRSGKPVLNSSRRAVIQ